MTAPFFIGIDVGTQGARVILTDTTGAILSSKEEAFSLTAQSREEQLPEDWWNACVRSCSALVAECKRNIPLTGIRAIAVTSTSGTVIPLDKHHKPLHAALMYSDKRSESEGRMCREAALSNHPDGYTGFNSSSGLSKMVWYVRNFPAKVSQISRWVHAADYIAGKLSGAWGMTDYTNALKSGFDVARGVWPSYLFESLPLKRQWFPEVVFSGVPISKVDPRAAQALGLPPDIVVVAGMTDGCASQVASGAVALGGWNTTIGTTLVVKGVTRNEVRDSEGRIYSHRHPEGYWMPGGASNTGADWVTKEFSDNFKALEQAANAIIPTGLLSFPLRQEGERFPFIAPQARGFQPQGLSGARLFASNMEGVAYVERYAYELIESLSGEKVNTVFTAGGGSKNDTWLTIRSNVLNLPIVKMKNVSGAVGAAILAASKTFFSKLTDAADAMTQVEKRIVPDPKLTTAYERYYQDFIMELRERNFIKGETPHA